MILATRQIFTVLLLMAVVCGCSRKEQPYPSPQIPRKADASERMETRPANPKALLAASRDEMPLLAVETPRDVLPNGLATAMAPILVDWERSRQKGDRDDYYVVHNVVIGGNPIQGRLVLGSVRIPVDGIKSVEFNTVVARIGNRDTGAGHGQIRFLFEPDHRPVILGRKAEPIQVAEPVDDLIFSWEAWRPPRETWSGRKGLDPETYALTMRGYTGPERFLMDTLRNSAWECYPIALPDVDGAAHDVLRTVLVMGDGLARRNAREMFARLTEDWGPLPEDYHEEANRLHALFSPDAVPDDPLAHLMGEADLSYHLLLRSCITQALTAIDLGVRSTYWRTDDKEGLVRPRLQVAPENLPPWLDRMAHASPAQVLAKVPALAYWVAKNQQVVPGNAYMILEDGGLLQKKDGELVKYYYHADQMTPYGTIADNIMY